jgi:hypothetical protein
MATAFVQDGAKTAIELDSLQSDGSFPLSLSLELLLIELVSEFKDCLSRLDAVTSFTAAAAALVIVPSEHEDELPLAFACFDL